jgi:hypothetical protein
LKNWAFIFCDAKKKKKKTVTAPAIFFLPGKRESTISEIEIAHANLTKFILTQARSWILK